MRNNTDAASAAPVWLLNEEGQNPDPVPMAGPVAHEYRVSGLVQEKLS
jgi:hypothetical protein